MPNEPMGRWTADRQIERYAEEARYFLGDKGARRDEWRPSVWPCITHGVAGCEQCWPRVTSPGVGA